LDLRIPTAWLRLTFARAWNLSGSNQHHAIEAVKVEEDKSTPARSSIGSDRSIDANRETFAMNWQKINIRKYIPNGSNFLYHRVPNDSRSTSPFSLEPLKQYGWSSPGRSWDRTPPIFRRFSPSRILWAVIGAIVFLVILATTGTRQHHESIPDPPKEESKPEPFGWQHYPRLVAIRKMYNSVILIKTQAERILQWHQDIGPLLAVHSREQLQLHIFYPTQNHEQKRGSQTFNNASTRPC